MNRISNLKLVCLVIKATRPHLSEFMVRFCLILISVLLLCCSAEDKSPELFVKASSFYGCESKKRFDITTSSNCVVQYEVLSNQYLKIIRQGERLNCGTDSIAVNLECINRSVQIKEIQCIDKAAYCECNMCYEYIIGPLTLPDYEINILSPAGSTYKFMVNTKEKILKSTCE